MRMPFEMNPSRIAGAVAALALFVSFATVALSQFENIPTVLEQVCWDSSDRVARQTYRALCDEYAEQEGFQAGVFRPFTSEDTPIFNANPDYCDDQAHWVCVGIGPCGGLNCSER